MSKPDTSKLTDQDFIKQARKTQDLWAGSFLLIFLIAQAMLAVAKEIGPDAMGRGSDRKRRSFFANSSSSKNFSKKDCVSHIRTCHTNNANPISRRNKCRTRRFGVITSCCACKYCLFSSLRKFFAFNFRERDHY